MAGFAVTRSQGVRHAETQRRRPRRTRRITKGRTSNYLGGASYPVGLFCWGSSAFPRPKYNRYKYDSRPNRMCAGAVRDFFRARPFPFSRDERAVLNCARSGHGVDLAPRSDPFTGDHSVRGSNGKGVAGPRALRTHLTGLEHGFSRRTSIEQSAEPIPVRSPLLIFSAVASEIFSLCSREWNRVAVGDRSVAL